MKKKTKYTRHPELVEYYRNYPGEKTSYHNFYQRHKRLGYSLDRAIQVYARIGGVSPYKITEEGRICSKCKEFKPWDQYYKSKTGTNRKTSNCRDCLHRKKKAYLSSPSGKAQAKKYREKRRKLEIGEFIAFLDPVYHEGAPREDSYEVVGYQYKKGYTIQSVLTGKRRRIDTADNPLSAKFYRIPAPIILEENAPESDLFLIH